MLSACESKTTGKRVAIPEKMENTGITGGAVVETDTVETGETGKTAAETLKELQTMDSVQETTDGLKTGTFYRTDWHAGAYAETF